MKIKAITEKTDKELATLITTTGADLEKLMIDMRTKQVKNVKQIWALKKTIARANTIRREREIAQLEQTHVIDLVLSKSIRGRNI